MNFIKCAHTGILAAVAVFAVACNHSQEAAPVKTDAEISKAILTDFSTVVAHATYTDLINEATALENSVLVLDSSLNTTNLNNARNAWRKVRSTWEKSEAFLIGPVETDNIDPSIDTWPVNRLDLDSLLNHETSHITANWLNNQQESLKGFHPLEYMLFGENGGKQASDFTPAERVYMRALATNLKQTIAKLGTAWNNDLSHSYGYHFTNAGTLGSQIGSKKEAYLQLVEALANIADEVGKEKLGEPFLQQNASLEESPFSKNSIADFSNNVTGVLNVYTCNYSGKGTSLSDFTQKYNRDLDLRIKQQIQQCIAAMAQITLPFGEAIFQQKNQIQNAQNQLSTLNEMMGNDLKNLVLARIKD